VNIGPPVCSSVETNTTEANKLYETEGKDALCAETLPDSVLLLPGLEDVELYQVRNLSGGD